MFKSKLREELEIELKVYEKALSKLMRNTSYFGGLCTLLDVTAIEFGREAYNTFKQKQSQFTFQNAVNSGHLFLENLTNLEIYELDYEQLKTTKQGNYYWWKSYTWEASGRLGFLIWMICTVRQMLSKPMLTLKERILLLELYMIPIYTNDYKKNPCLNGAFSRFHEIPSGLCNTLTCVTKALLGKGIKSTQEDMLIKKLLIIDNTPGMNLMYCGLKYPFLIKLLGGKHIDSSGRYWWLARAKRRLYYMRILLSWFKIQLFFNKIF